MAVCWLSPRIRSFLPSSLSETDLSVSGSESAFWNGYTLLWTDHGQTFPDPVPEVLQTIQESVRSVNTTGLLRFADILVQPPAP